MDLTSPPASVDQRPPVAGSDLPHDTETPDVHTSSPEYRHRFEGGGRLALVRQTEAVARALRLATAQRLDTRRLDVLDVGGAHGQLAELLRDGRHRVVVHGSSEECFRDGTAASSADPDDMPRCVSSLWRLPFAEDTFDLVAGVRLMAHVTRWRELLAEMSRVSRRFVLVDFPLLSGVQRLSSTFFGMKRKVERNTRPFFLYRRTEVLDHLAAINVQPVLWIGELVLPLALHRLVRMPRTSASAERALAVLGLGDRFGSPVLLLGEKMTSPARAMSGTGGVRA
jgi:SAM-dependent methyltransferase